MNDHITLFRFLSAESALKTIDKRTLRIGRLAELNDPFEWRMGITEYRPEGEIVVRACLEEYLRCMNDEIGILCFSDTAAESVLWSHYADHHRGICLELNFPRTEHLEKMSYTNDRPFAELSWLHDSKDPRLRPVFDQLLRQKSSGWAYEREYRAFFDLNQCSIVAGSYFRPLPPNYLKRVLLGFRCSLSEQYIIRLLHQVGLDSVEVVKVKDGPTSYEIRY